MKDRELLIKNGNKRIFIMRILEENTIKDG